ncbi:MAG: autotransporter-associated beta strand repeat-containing protein, partial [Thermoguttaceae bacterium]
SGWLLSPATLINGGVLTLANSAAMPNSGSIFFGGGTLRYSGSNTVDYSAEIVSSPGPISIDTNGANITFASSLASSNNGGLTKIGNGTLTLAASNSYTGTTTIVGGILSLANSAAVPSSGNITFGGGTLQYGASNTQDYSGSIVGSTGPISIDTNNADIIFASSLASSNTGGLTKIGSGTLTLVAVNSFSGNALISGGTLVLGNPLALENSTLDTSGLGVLSFGSLSAATLGGLSGPATLALSSSACSSLVLRVGNNGADTTFSGTLTGAGSLIKVGSGSLLLSGSNIYTGGTALNCGVLSLANAAALPGGGSITFGGGTLQYSGSNSVDYSGSIVGSTGPLSIDTNGTNVTFASALGNSNTSGLTKIGSGTLLLLASNAYTGSTTISGGTLQIGNGGSGASIADTSGLLDNGALAFNHSDAVTFSPSISGSGTLTQAGSGVLTLAGSNPYSGQTTISAGAVSLNNANSVQNSTVTVNVNSGLLFNSNSGAIATYNVGGLAGNGNISLADGSYAIALSVGGNGASTSYSGALSGAGSLIKFGSGDLVLSASNSYTGSTTLSGGSLQVGNGGTGASIASTSSVVDNGSLVFDHSDAVSFSPRISGAGGLTQTGPGVLTLTGSNTYAGRTTVSAGAISLNNANAVQNSTVTVIPNDGLLFNSNSGAIATYNIGGLAGNGNISLADGSYAIALSVGGNGASTTYGGAIGGSGGLNKIGSGTLTLTRPNAYAGPTAVEAGDLKLLSAATGAIGIQFMGLGSAIGAARNGVFNMTNWNSFIGTTLGSQSGALKDSNGNATSAVLNSFYGTNPWKTGSSVPLLNGYLDNTGGTDTVTISNIPYAYYNVIAYFGSDVAGREGSVELSTAGATYYYKAEGNTTSYVRTTSTNGTYVPANYAVWSGVSGGSLTISQQLGTGFQNNGLNGIQIVGANGSVLPTSTALTIAANATLDLGGVQQQVASLSDYTPGSGGSIVNSATSASVLTLSPTGGSTTFSGTIIGGGTLGAISLVMSGSGTQLLAGSMIGPGSLTANSGTLILSGSNTYAGGTTVEGGTLAITTGNALPVNGSLTIGAGGMFIFDPMATAAPFASTGVSVSAVPEPSTLALLGAVAIGLLTCARRRRKPTAC